MARKLVCIENVTLIRSTEKAGMYQTEDGDEVWIPWSQIDENSVDKDGDSGDIWIPLWLAEAKELEYLEEDE